MGRRIVVCIDGTNNYPGAGLTNIQRLVRMLGDDDGQLIYYQPGAGTIEPDSLTLPWSRKLLKFVDSVSALMLQRHVCSAYRFLMAHYRRGDELYFFGFSRGAYAVRVLAGMLSKVGLLRDGFDEMLPFAWSCYATRGNNKAANEFRNAYCHYVRRICFLGLFDSVSAVGTPWRPRTFERTFRNLSVVAVRHALALDERRAMFVQNLWSEQPSTADPDEDDSSGSDVRQVWFPGVHADIGGGYAEAEAGLSRIPLAWMKHEAEAAGLVFRPLVSAAILDPTRCSAQPDIASVAAQCAGAEMHDELRAHLHWRWMEWLPLPRWRRDDSGQWRRLWRPHRSAARALPNAALLHESARLRQSRLPHYEPAPTLQDPVYVM
jgi:uncharacterized protein (DUF2235 family)